MTDHLTWIEYDADRDATRLEGDKSYLCRCESKEGEVRYRTKQFIVYGGSYKRGYFATAGAAYKVTHIADYPRPEGVIDLNKTHVEKLKDTKISLLKDALGDLIQAIDKNVTGLWKPDLSETQDCIILDECEIQQDPDDDNTIVEFEGINKTINAVKCLLKV